MAARYNDELEVSGDAQPGADESDDDVISFAQQIARSSFGSPEVQRDRRLGRGEIAAYGPPPEFESGSHVSAADNRDRPELAVDQEVADELEHAGYTFEAEMRYRRLAANYGFSPDRLAPMLESKGRTPEAFQWYIAAAMHRDSNSLFRLALACDLRGHYGWAQKLLRQASASLRRAVFDSVQSALKSIAIESRPMVIAEHLCNFAWKERDANVTYALGSIVCVAGGRPDLARLIFSSALAKGHPLAALSLVDLVPSRSFRKKQALDQLDVLEVGSALFDPPESDDGHERWLAIQSSMNTFAKHLAYPGKGGVARPLPDGSVDRLYSSQVQRIVNVAQQIAVLQGYAAMPCDHRSLRIIKNTSVEIAWRVRENVIARRDADLLAYVAFAFEQAAMEYAAAKPPKGRAASSRIQVGRPDINRFDQHIPCSGVVHRFQHSLKEDLDEDERRVLILRLSGMSLAEVSQILGFSEDVVRKYEKHATQKLFTAQNDRHYDAGDCPGIGTVRRSHTEHCSPT